MWISRSLFLACSLLLCWPAPQSLSYDISAEDRELLEKVQKDTFQFFIRMSDRETGFTKDSSKQGSPSSIAATGFSLAAFAIAHEHGWVKQDYAYAYLKKTLTHLLDTAEHERGFYYHFIDARSGNRVWASEASSIDTALLVAGALLAGRYFPDTEIEEMAQKIYRRIDWDWMRNGSDFVSMGWKPESGFLPYYWDNYSEMIILQALAIGSPTHPIPDEAWDAWLRNTDVFQNKAIIFASTGSLFTYQYSHAYIDFRELDDAGINYFKNSVDATIANREYSMLHRVDYKSYSENSWGLSASVGPGGYKAYGGKPGAGLHDGTITPYASISSIVFTPEESLAATKFMYEEYGERVYGHFGFKGAYNVDKNWWSDEYLGIDQGIILLMLENFLNDGAVWEKFMQLVPVQRWIKVCDLLQPVSDAEINLDGLNEVESNEQLR